MKGARRLTAIIVSQNSTVESSSDSPRSACGVVDEDVEAASTLDGRADDVSAGLDTCEVARHGVHLVSRRAEPVGRGVRAAGIRAMNDDVCAQGCEMRRNAVADAGGRPRDERDLVFKGRHSS